ncbi:MAG: DedA family protein [Gemmatimonadales bacterium]
MAEFVDLFLHLDQHLADFVTQYGPWVYGILFLIVFAETGLVVTPFLPGDSLLFAVGALAAVGTMDAPLAATLLVIAAVAGDAANYAIGRYVGPRVFRASSGGSFVERALNREHLARAHEFFERYGGKAVVLGRFVPIVRTFVPFVAGAGSMTYPKFALYNVLGALAWVGICLGGGYAFGNVPFVRDNFTFVALGIVAVSLLPMVFELVQARRRTGAPPAQR